MGDKDAGRLFEISPNEQHIFLRPEHTWTRSNVYYNVDTPPSPRVGEGVGITGLGIGASVGLGVCGTTV